MTGLEKNIKLAGLRSCLRSLTVTYRRNFNQLSIDALEINLIIKEILRLEEGEKDEQNR